MVENIFETFTNQAKNFSNPFEKFNSILMKNMEKVAELQVETMKSLVEMGNSQVKAFSEIKDLEGLKNFSSDNVSRMTEYNQKVMSDVKSMGEIGINFKHDIEQLMADFKGNFEASDEASKEAPAGATAPRGEDAAPKSETAAPKADVKAKGTHTTKA